MDYTSKKRPELLDLALERGFQGVAKRTKRELISLLESADREMADLRLRQRRRRQMVEQLQMQAAEVADLPITEQQQPQPHSLYKRTIAYHLLKAITSGSLHLPLLTAAFFASATHAKNEKPSAPTFTVHSLQPLHAPPPLQAINEASCPPYEF